MPAPPIVQGDKIMGTCVHQIPAAAGAPAPSPMPFSAPLTDGTVDSVKIAGRAAAVAGSSGKNMPPHVGLHASDPNLAPQTQVGQIVSGSTTVLIGGKPAATATSTATCCIVPGSLVPTVSNVLIG